MSESTTMRDVLDGLETEGYIDADHFDHAAETLANQTSESAWYIQGLLGCGGWMAALFGFGFIGGFIILPFLEEGLSAAGIVISVILIGGTVFLQRAVDNLAVSQFALAYNIAGQLLLLFTLAETFNYDDFLIPSAIVILALQLILLPLYNDTTYRFLAGLAVAGAIHVIIWELEIPYAVSVVGVILAGLTTLIWGGFVSSGTVITLRPIVRPASYALIVSLIGTTIWELFVNNEYSYVETTTAFASPILSSVAFTALTLLVLVRVLQSYDVPVTSIMAIGAIGFIVFFAFPSILAPGLMGAALLLLLGMRNTNGTLIAMGYLYLYGFIGYFYYSLETSLLMKSFIMMGSGLVMLGGWWWLRREYPAPPANLKAKAKEAV
jgi:uncharacterized membrane protein